MARDSRSFLIDKGNVSGNQKKSKLGVPTLMDYNLITAVKEVVKVYSMTDWNDLIGSTILENWMKLNAVIKRELNEDLNNWDEYFFYSYEEDMDEKDKKEFVYKIISTK